LGEWEGIDRDSSGNVYYYHGNALGSAAITTVIAAFPASHFHESIGEGMAGRALGTHAVLLASVEQKAWELADKVVVRLF
jgi:hypothetical protein